LPSTTSRTLATSHRHLSLLRCLFHQTHLVGIRFALSSNAIHHPFLNVKPTESNFHRSFNFPASPQGRIIYICMPSFSDSIVLFILALLLFGPKRLPVLARELGKWVGEFRRASNEFKMQMEDELRQVEQADRQKQIAAMEAAAPVAPALSSSSENTSTPSIQTPASPSITLETSPYTEAVTAPEPAATPAPELEPAPEPSPAPLPIATSGELHIMPPSTGLPTARVPRENASRDSALSSLLNSIPEAPAPETSTTETTAHGN
jgi:sec-independent protein translocase protein TatB